MFSAPCPHLSRPLGLDRGGRRHKLSWRGVVKAQATVNVAFTFPELELDLEETQVRIHGRLLSIFQPRDVDEVLEMYITQNRLDRDPYWCRLWPSALALADEILAHPELVCGLRVCDLGAGLGLAGLAAALSGASEVVLYDREIQALVCALLNIHANIPDASSNLPEIIRLLPISSQQSGTIGNRNLPAPVVDILTHSACTSVTSHSTSDRQGVCNALGTVQACIKAELFDWTHKLEQGPDFDVVLACDVLYEKPAIRLIADLAPKLLSTREGSRLLVSDPVERNPKNRELFVHLFERDQEHFKEHGMGLEAREVRSQRMDGAEHEVELLQFTRKTLGRSNQLPVEMGV